MSNTQLRSFPVVPDDFGHWLAGLIDGEGCFSIHPVNGTGWQAHFYLCLRADDRAVLDLIAKTTGLGRLYDRHRQERGQPAVLWMVYRRLEKMRLVELLDQHPLRAKKARDFAIWREAIRLLAGGRQGQLGPSRDLARLSRQLRDTRSYDSEAAVAPLVDDGWLSLFEDDGTIEARAAA